MILTKETIQKILGIKGCIRTTSETMANNLTVTFFPFNNAKDKEIIAFANKLRTTLKRLGVKIIPYQSALIRSNKIKEDIAIIALGDGKTGNLPVNHITNPRNNSIVAIVKMPPHINEATSLEDHINTSIRLFAYHMSNIVVCVDKKRWLVYTLNGFSPLYTKQENFSSRILNTLIPKLATPVRPLLISDFKVKKWNMNAIDEICIRDILKASRLFKNTAFYPPQKSILSLPFKNDFYKKVGRMYLDKRSGMSYGFFSRQLPTKMSPLVSLTLTQEKTVNKKKYFLHRNNLYIVIKLFEEMLCMAVPDVWVITTRSGCDKTNIDPKRDLIKLGLVNGERVMQVSSKMTLLDDYRPSFDTVLILAHALANAIYGSILLYRNPGATFPKILSKQGMALAHWHGYIKYAPTEWHSYGMENPAVPCSSYQSAMYVFKGKEEILRKCLVHNEQWLGEIHIEAQHGVNVTYNSLIELSEIILRNLKCSINLSKVH